MREKVVHKFRRLTDYMTSSGGLPIIVILFTVYAAALSGSFSPFGYFSALSKLQPLLFVLIGYCFAIIPSRHSQTILAAELLRREHQAESAQFAKERLGQEREALEEKIKNAASCLSGALRTGTTADREVVRAAVKSAVEILRSN